MELGNFKGSRDDFTLFWGSVVNLWSFWGEYTTMSIKIRALHAKWGDTVISKNSACCARISPIFHKIPSIIAY